MVCLPTDQSFRSYRWGRWFRWCPSCPRSIDCAQTLSFLTQENITWVDVTAPGDGCAFALCNPVSVSGWQQMPNAGHWFSQRPSPKHSALRAGKNCAEISFGCISNICSPLIAHVIMIIFRLQRAHKHWVIAMPIVRRQNHGSIAPFLKTHWWPHDRSSAKAKNCSNKVSLLHYMRLFRQDIILAQPATPVPRVDG